jgi:hypothetical protein
MTSMSFAVADRPADAEAGHGVHLRDAVDDDQLRVLDPVGRVVVAVDRLRPSKTRRL